jgi:FkbM family methyltransferase
MASRSDRSRVLEADGFNQLAAGKDGYFVYNRNDRYIGRSIERYGEWSGLEMDLFRQVCAPGYIVIEVGANIGAHTVGLARLVGPSGRVLAFEPQRLVFQALCANIALNSLVNVDCFWSAVGTQEGLIRVPEMDPNHVNNFGGFSLLGANGNSEVACETLDRRLGLPRLDFIKIDVEGMEIEVLRGGAQLLQKFKPILYVENDRIERSSELMHLISEHGYRMFWHMPPLFNPQNHFGETEDLWPGVVSANLLCVHRERDATLNGFEEVLDFSSHPWRR